MEKTDSLCVGHLLAVYVRGFKNRRGIFMKTNTKKLCSVLLALALVLTTLPLTALPATAATAGDFTYVVLSETM